MIEFSFTIIIIVVRFITNPFWTNGRFFIKGSLRLCYDFTFFLEDCNCFCAVDFARDTSDTSSKASHNGSDFELEYEVVSLSEEETKVPFDGSCSGTDLVKQFFLVKFLIHD